MIRIYCLKKIKIEKKKSLFKKEYIQVGESQEVQSPSPTQTSHQPASWEYAGSPACCSPLEGPLALMHSRLRYPLCWNFSVTIVLHFLFTACSVQTGN